ncbi:HIT family protein [Ramlibacter sp.]|uniref:HIT family protein n=1 Tax=Ramlibacter sp. TaxID=1917967 RepID=UPI002BBF29AC|nr:HIT family protein [Ramlibacter sp.]HWI83919.1 HIT family protein [Ramlibacter sp.]
MREPGCPLCEGAGGTPVFQAQALRVIRTDEGGFPAFYRVVWNDHVRELSDLGRAQRQLCLEAVVVVEEALRRHLRPAKVNLAALGNMVAHLHWHVIARFEWDSHFPAPVWAAAQREAPAAEVARVVAARPLLEADIARQLATLCAS